MLKKLYRKNLKIDDVNLIALYRNDKWNYQTESVTIPQFDRLSDNAVVVGNGLSTNEFDLTKIMPSRATTAWGEVGAWVNKRQRRNFYVYGCNAIYRNFKPDFITVTGDGIIKEIAESTVDKSNIIYAYNNNLEKYPAKFNFLPQNPEFNSGALAAYMAAFDGHKKVYMLGFDGIDTLGNNYNIFAGTENYPDLNYPTLEEYWVRSLNTVMKTYSDTEFIRVAPSPRFRIPEQWKYNLNFRQIDFRQFVLEVDI